MPARADRTSDRAPAVNGTDQRRAVRITATARPPPTGPAHAGSARDRTSDRAPPADGPGTIAAR